MKYVRKGLHADITKGFGIWNPKKITSAIIGYRLSAIDEKTPQQKKQKSTFHIAQQYVVILFLFFVYININPTYLQ